MTDDLYAGIDPFRVAAGLTAAEQALLARVRAFGEDEVAPIVADHWERAACPAQLRERFAELGLADAPGAEPERAIFAGLRTFELARVAHPPGHGPLPLIRAGPRPHEQDFRAHQQRLCAKRLRMRSAG